MRLAKILKFIDSRQYEKGFISITDCISQMKREELEGCVLDALVRLKFFEKSTDDLKDCSFKLQAVLGTIKPHILDGSGKTSLTKEIMDVRAKISSMQRIHKKDAD